MGLHRALPGAAATDRDGVLRVEVDERPDVAPPATLTHELEREYRAVVEELLQLRGDDGRISAFVRSITGAGALADTAGYSPDISIDAEDRPARDARRRRAADAGACACRRNASPSCRCASGSATTWIPARRNSSASTSCTGRWTRSARSSARTKPRSPRSTARRSPPPGMPEKVQQQAERELSRFERMGDSNAESSMIRTYLDWLLAVPWSKRSEERLDPRPCAAGARCRPCRPR